ncbi:MAG: hypothetical protein Kow0098_28650 [Ignavibacteriaceae bacterium]
MLYDVKGEKISVLVSEEKDTGFYSVELNSKNLSSGIYFYIMTSSGGYYSAKKTNNHKITGVSTKKMLLLK